MLSRLRDRVLGALSGLKYDDRWHRRKIQEIHELSPEQKRTRGIRRSVRLLSNFPGLWQRTIEQTPGGNCQWGATLFVADGEADHYVILNSMRRPQAGSDQSPVQLPAPERVWGLHMEPEHYVRTLGYADQAEHALVSRFYTNCESLIARGGIYRPSPPYVHFHVGKSWDFLNKAQPGEKPVTLGIICSGLDTTEGHRTRLDFLEEIDASDLDCAIWGRGENLRRFRKYRGFVPSKWAAHSLCRYTIVIENSVSPWYWTEKPADALLAWSLPLYHGSSALSRFLPPESFIPFDIREPGRLDALRHILEQDPYEDRLPAISNARTVLLNEQNLYAFLDQEMEKG